MKLSENDFKNYTAILREELIPAMGCTEPIAIAYAAAMIRKLLGEMPIRITVNCSGNIIKNVKGVTVPNSGDPNDNTWRCLGSLENEKAPPFNRASKPFQHPLSRIS